LKNLAVSSLRDISRVMRFFTCLPGSDF
jgi:hypothetical protein